QLPDLSDDPFFDKCPFYDHPILAAPLAAIAQAAAVVATAFARDLDHRATTLLADEHPTEKRGWHGLLPGRLVAPLESTRPLLASPLPHLASSTPCFIVDDFLVGILVDDPLFLR